MARLRTPLLVFHGNRDEIVPHRLGEKLFEAAPEPKAFETIAGAGHNDTTLVGGRSYFERIRRFLERFAPSVGACHRNSNALSSPHALRMSSGPSNRMTIAS